MYACMVSQQMSLCYFPLFQYPYSENRNHVVNSIDIESFLEHEYYWLNVTKHAVITLCLFVILCYDDG